MVTWSCARLVQVSCSDSAIRAVPRLDEAAGQGIGWLEKG